MKRGSFIAPLILILIGTVFLMKNIRPDWPLFETVFTWWPVLLIGWGLIRALEILTAYFAGRSLPVKGISGGEWAVVVIITIIGTGVWSAQHFAEEGFGRIRVGGVEVFGESFDYPVKEAKLETGATPRISIEVGRGSVRVIGADTKEVKVTARKTVRALNRKYADEADRDTPLVANVSGGVVTIRAGMDQADNIRVNYDMEITVPKTSSLDCKAKSTDFDISDVDGRVVLDSDRSAVRLQNMGGSVLVDTRSSDLIRAIDLRGDIELKGRGRDIDLENVAGQVTVNGGYSGETTMRNIQKPVRFESSVTDIRIGKVIGSLNLSLRSLTGDRLAGPVEVKAKSKDVRLTDVSDNVLIDLDRGDVELIQTKPLTGKTEVRVRAGDVEFALPPNARFSLDAETSRGEVHNDFGQSVKEEVFNRGGRMRVELPGAPSIIMRTDRGAVTLRKSSAADSPAPVVDAYKPPRPPQSPPPPPPPRADNQ